MPLDIGGLIINVNGMGSHVMQGTFLSMSKSHAQKIENILTASKNSITQLLYKIISVKVVNVLEIIGRNDTEDIG